MNILKLLYAASLVTLAIAFHNSPASKLVHPDFPIAFLFTVGIPLLLLPFISINKAEIFYQKAKIEGRTRGDTERAPAPVEEEYRIDAIILMTLFTILSLLISYFLIRAKG